MRKQVFATIGCAIFLLIVVGFLMMAYSSYTKHQEEIAEQKLIKQERKRITKNTSIIRRKGMESGLPVGACYRN